VLYDVFSAALSAWDGGADVPAGASEDVLQTHIERLGVFAKELRGIGAETIAVAIEAAAIDLSSLASRLAPAQVSVTEEIVERFAKIAMERHEFGITQTELVGTLYKEAYQDACVDIANDIRKAALSAPARQDGGEG